MGEGIIHGLAILKVGVTGKKRWPYELPHPCCRVGPILFSHPCHRRLIPHRSGVEGRRVLLLLQRGEEEGTTVDGKRKGFARAGGRESVKELFGGRIDILYVYRGWCGVERLNIILLFLDGRIGIEKNTRCLIGRKNGLCLGGVRIGTAGKKRWGRSNLIGRWGGDERKCGEFGGTRSGVLHQPRQGKRHQSLCILFVLYYYYYYFLVKFFKKRKQQQQRAQLKKKKQREKKVHTITRKVVVIIALSLQNNIYIYISLCINTRIHLGRSFFDAMDSRQRISFEKCYLSKNNTKLVALIVERKIEKKKNNNNNNAIRTKKKKKEG